MARPARPSARPTPSRRRRQPTRARTARAASAFVRLVEIMTTLRSPHGCPWDRKQTHATLRPYLLEETYEAIDALDRRDLDALPGELGDVLFQCVFHAQLAAERGRFDIADIVEGVSEKLIRRHPHVFTADGRPLSAAERRRLGIGRPDAVVEQWSRIKARERADAGHRPRVLAGLPRALPALSRAQRIGTRVAAVGFDWPDADDVLEKVDEELAELRAARHEGRHRTMDEMGDVLFTVANLARKLGIDPEEALSRANDKFTRRFNRVETHLERLGTDVHAASPETMDAAWTIVKARSGSAGSTRSARSRSARRAGARPSRR